MARPPLHSFSRKSAEPVPLGARAAGLCCAEQGPVGVGAPLPRCPATGYPSGERGSFPRTGDSGVRFREGPAPNAFLMQTGAQAACWAPPSPPAPAAPASPPGRPRARRFLLLLPLPFPGPALAEVLTAGSRGGGGAQMGLLSPPPPFPRPCLAALAGLGWLAQLRDGVESGRFPGLRRSQGVGDTMTGGLQIPQATFSAKVTEARGETQQRGEEQVAPAPAA